ncbi:TonB-dependent receptor [Sphingobacterium sp. UT-1RO-CII-1]|uniref:SusC/RagA family TonB-linked outer membrane protein n=1 Tax=Sphingobacterium sp. UT-1RO-CII-1 TaxID=2995225 RepID=UPI00227BE654|nr:TonB-dependent receptor [Sphingobacterium sp. UT-1RO-CII-1]MCY4778551.1 TonB-dependent receptor [Sphingobacterium sp. UT-1RO-CII-1]
MKKIIFNLIVVCFFPCVLLAQKNITGIVVDTETKEPLAGVTVFLKDEPAKALSTDIEGKYEVTTTAKGPLIFQILGYSTQEVEISSSAKQIINVELTQTDGDIEEVQVVGFGTQRKISVTGAISTVKAEDLARGSVTSISNALAGRVAGLVGVQSSGEPGSDVSEFWIRGISTFGANSSALVLIDGVDRGPNSLNDISPEDIESFSILKDASATAVYGARGANGVVLINTKRGVEGRMAINANVKTMLEKLPRLPKYVNAHEYALLANEARAARGQEEVYSKEIFNILKYNMDPDLYPDVNWQNEILKDYTYGTYANLSVTGGSKLANYYMSGSYRTNDAIYKQSGMEKYNSNVNRNQYGFRSNIDVNVTKTTSIALTLSAKLIDMNRPGIGTTSQIWAAQSNLTPLSVPVVFSNGMLPAYGKDENQTSPSVLLNETGFVTERSNALESIVNLKQKLDFITEGLSFSGLVSFDNANYYTTSRRKMPDLYKAVGRDWNTGNLLTQKTVVSTPPSFSSEQYGIRTIYIEGKMDYSKNFLEDRLRFGTMALYTQRDYQRTDAGTSLSAIPKRNQGVAARGTLSFDDVYFLEGNFGYNGSENFPKGERFGFFPSLSLGYVLSNNKFFSERVPFIDFLKFRYSYGLVGNDQISNDVRFPYLSTIDVDAAGYSFGDQGQNYMSGVIESKLGSSGLVWEKAIKQNFGLDLTAFSTLEINIDAFLDHRNNIFMQRVTLPGTMGTSTVPWGNVGKMKSWGTDGTISYKHDIGEFSLEGRGNFTLTRDKILDYDEVSPLYPYLGKKGTSNNVTRGLVALGLFRDELDVESSPKQFGSVMPGDIKYLDINGDGVIDDYDIVPIGNSNIPKFQYGFALAASWRSFDVNIFFRGASQVDYFMGGSGYYPFAGGETGNVLTIVNNPDNRWIPAEVSGDKSTENPNARFPRLSYENNTNNNRASSFWLADASYLRLKTLEVGYTLPKRLTERMRIKSLRLSMIGDNLHLWDKVKLWDPEQASSNGAVYPLTRSYTMVLQLSF